jgi:hypothetical protein
MKEAECGEDASGLRRIKNAFEADNCNTESHLASNIAVRLPTFDRFLSPLFL